MSYEAERQTITSAFKTAWEAGANLPVQWFNTAFSPPADGGPYVAFTVLRGESRQASLSRSSQALFRHPGVVQIDISIAQNKGSRIGLLLADEVATIFRGKRIGGIIFYAPDVREMIEPETSRLRFIVSIAFNRDTLLTI